MADDSRAPDPLPRIGPRVVLRRLRPEDIADFQAYRSDPEVGRYQGWSPMSLAEAHAFIVEMGAATFGLIGQWVQIAIADRATDRLIGDIGVCLRADGGKHAEIGYSLATGSQGKGLASEAVLAAILMLFESTGIDHIVGVTDARNEASGRLLKRVGMTLQDTVNTVFRGEPCVEHVYAIHREVLMRLLPPAAAALRLESG